MTEEEAKTKWCFMMAMHALPCDETCRYDRHDGVVGSRCLASACMAWHWDDPNKTQGYCGLAGVRG